MIAALLLTLFTTLPVAPPTTDHVDLIEVNHVHNPAGRHVLSQLIFYDWDPATARFQVRAWRLLQSPDQRPRRVRIGSPWVSQWLDGKRYRRVEAAGVRETWTAYDVEIAEREMLPCERRRGLTGERGNPAVAD